MHLARLRLRDFRNYWRLDMEFVPGFHVLTGDNAQGKTNLLEAVYLLATLRSFRGVGAAQMVGHRRKALFVGAQVVAETEREIRYYWSPSQRKLSLDGREIKRLSDYLGTLQVVVFCAEDIQLVKGPGRVRRRFLDLLLTQTRPGYLALLHRYAGALRSRNALLKNNDPDPALQDGFTYELVESGNTIMEARRELAGCLLPRLQQGCGQISGTVDEAALEYSPSVRQDFVTELANSRERELRYRSTLVGPHRDELRLVLDGKPVAQFGSAGQKRTLAIALKMAQAEFLAEVHGAPPILLVDDVMGELDARRRKGLMPLITRTGEARGQVFMTCTEENWSSQFTGGLCRWRILQGKLEAQ